MKFRNKKTGEIKEFEAVCINAALVSAQNRKWLFWSNIPNIEQPVDKGILLRDVLEIAVGEEFYVRDKSNTIRSSGRGSGVHDKHNWDQIAITERRTEEASEIRKEMIRTLTPIECERLQGLPDNYTEGISTTQRYRCLGNAFHVDVIAHILSHIK